MKDSKALDVACRIFALVLGTTVFIYSFIVSNRDFDMDQLNAEIERVEKIQQAYEERKRSND